MPRAFFGITGAEIPCVHQDGTEEPQHMRNEKSIHLKEEEYMWDLDKDGDTKTFIQGKGYEFTDLIHLVHTESRN